MTSVSRDRGRLRRRDRASPARRAPCRCTHDSSVRALSLESRIRAPNAPCTLAATSAGFGQAQCHRGYHSARV